MYPQITVKKRILSSANTFLDSSSFIPTSDRQAKLTPIHRTPVLAGSARSSTSATAASSLCAIKADAAIMAAASAPLVKI